MTESHEMGANRRVVKPIGLKTVGRFALYGLLVNKVSR
jgi:hypothetical protein